MRYLAAALLLATTAHAQTEPFKLTIPGASDGGALSLAQVYNSFGCEGSNLSPALTWGTPPAGTQSLAVTVFDPDAPTGSGWWHWTVANIPATEKGLKANAGDPTAGTLPAAATMGRTDYGVAAFGGACPPQGDKPHRYQFTVWALKTPNMPVNEQTSGAMAGYMINRNALASSTITLTYGR